MAAAGPQSPDVLSFTWQAFLLTVVNFLILVALLYKLLHKPLLDILRKRRESIEGARKKAEDEAAQARATREEYGQKLASIGEERDRLLSEARRKAEEERERLVTKGREDAERQFSERETAYEREQREALANMQDEIIDTSLKIAAGILGKLTGADLESALHRQLLDELDALASKDKPELADGKMPVRALSARPLTREQQSELTKRVRALVGSDTEIAFETDEGLVAGTRVEFSTKAVDSTVAGVIAGVRERVGKADAAPEKDDKDKES